MAFVAISLIYVDFRTCWAKRKRAKRGCCSAGSQNGLLPILRFWSRQGFLALGLDRPFLVATGCAEQVHNWACVQTKECVRDSTACARNSTACARNSTACGRDGNP